MRSPQRGFRVSMSTSVGSIRSRDEGGERDAKGRCEQSVRGAQRGQMPMRNALTR